MSNYILKSIKHGYMIIQWMWLLGFQKKTAITGWQRCVLGTRVHERCKEMTGKNFLLLRFLLRCDLLTIFIWFLLFWRYWKQSGWNQRDHLLEMHGDWPFSRWTTSAKQLRLVNIKLDPNWIAAEPAESRSANRFSEVGGRRRPGGFMAVCRGWDCWDSTGPSAGAWTTCGNLTFLGENTFLLKEQLLLGRRRRTRMLAPSDCCGRGRATAVSWKTFDSHMSSAASLDQAE